jgi:hypothetical protein
VCFADVIEVTELDGVDMAEMTEVDEVGEAVEMAEMAEMAEMTEVDEVGEAVEAAEMTEVDEAGEALDMAEVGEAAEMVEVADSTDLTPMLLSPLFLPCLLRRLSNGLPVLLGVQFWRNSNESGHTVLCSKNTKTRLLRSGHRPCKMFAHKSFHGP